MNCIVNGLHIAYTKTGSNEKVVLMVHGWMSNKEAFADLQKELSKKYTVISVDLPGFGASQKPDDVWGVEEQSAFIVDFLKKLEIKNVDTLIGHSLGGRIMLYILGHKMITPKRSVLLGSHGIKESGSVRNVTFKYIAKAGKVLLMPFPSFVKNKMQSLLYGGIGANASDYLNSGVMQAEFKKIISSDARPYAPNISVPVLLIYGSNDDQTPPRFGEIFKSLIPNSRLEVVSDAGHYVHNDQPNVTLELIQTFMES